MYNDQIITMEEHLKWFERVKSSQDSKHFIFEVKNARLE
jgi:hypothetical protein